jgi:hypothetical protein
MPAPAANPGVCAGDGAAGAGPEDGVANTMPGVGFGVPATGGETVRRLPGTTVPEASISSTVITLTVGCGGNGTFPSMVIRRDTSLVVGYERRYPLTKALVPDADCCAAGTPSTST